jgi:hypothetical protein
MVNRGSANDVDTDSRLFEAVTLKRLQVLPT